MSSSHPLRKDAEYDEIDQLFLKMTTEYCGIKSLIRCYNDAIHNIREFAAEMPEHESFIEVVIRVKLDGRSQRASKDANIERVSPYSERSTKPPNVLIRDRGLHQRLAICGKKANGVYKDIKLLPFMYGCEWCLTATMTPEQLHAIGEDASYTGGFFIKDGSPKYFLAHEKLSHNAILTTKPAGMVGLMTTLKTTDDRNNSIELAVVKHRGLYCLQATSFKKTMHIQVLDIVRQIYAFIAVPSVRKRFLRHANAGDIDTTVCDKTSFKTYWEDLVGFVAGELKDFVIIEGVSKDVEGDVLVSAEETMEKALKALFATPEIRTAHTLGSPLATLAHYPQLVIECIFPSVKSYEKKALILTNMLRTFVLTEHEIIPLSDRDDLGNKTYLIAAQLLKRDVTMNAGASLREPNKIYDPVLHTPTGDSEVFEPLEQTKLFKACSQLTVLSTPMSKFSRSTAVREINCSHMGYKCVSETPQSAKIGLVSHMAVSSCASRDNDKYAIARLIESVLGTSGVRFRKGEITLSLMSIPYSTMTSAEYREIRRRLKTSMRFCDVAIVPEIYSTGANETRNIGYNILCDGGRLYRPLFNASRVKAVTEGIEGHSLRAKLNSYIRGKTYETLIGDGIIEMLFAVERTDYVIGETIETADLSKCDYLEINPVALFGTSGACAPMINHNPAGRSIHETNMAKSALTPGGTNMSLLSETSSKLLPTTEKAAVTTIHNDYYSRHYGNGINAYMMILITNTNIEDAMTVSKPFAQSLVTQRSSTIEIEVEQGAKVGIPPAVLTKKKYGAINIDSGLPIVGSTVNEGDCLFAMYKVNKATIEGEEDEIDNLSVFVERGKNGFISKIQSLTSETSTTYRITVSFHRALEQGDKLASRYSQKGVIGELASADQQTDLDDDELEVNDVIDRTRLPYVCEGVNKGLVPDIVFSPMSLTSRSTPGLINELHLGNYAVVKGQSVNATAFSVNMGRLEEAKRGLVEAGFNEDLYETFMDPVSGKKFKAYIGVCYIRVLEHTSFEKLKACSHIAHSVNKLTRQPTKGGLTGGLQEGTMELSTFIAHSASETVQQLYCRQSDRVIGKFCKECGHFNDKCGLLSLEEANSLATRMEISEPCVRCQKRALVVTETSYGALSIYFQMLAAGVRISMFPK